MQMGLDRGKAAQSRKTASLKVDFNGTYVNYTDKN